MASRISVALCTYNGDRFLRQQLQSILGQTRPPDEVVIADDGSRDGTLEIAEDLARTARVPVRVTVNRARLGSVRNFEQAIQLCEGDFIALADQDDEWVPRKLEQLERALEERGNQLVFSDAALVTADGEPIGRTLWQAIGFTPRDDEALTLGTLWKGNAVTGATAVFRRSALVDAVPFPDVVAEHGTPYHHDGWLAVAAAARGSVVPVREALMTYRLHDDQQVGLGGHARGTRGRAAWSGGIEHRRWLAQRSVSWLEEIEMRFGDGLTAADLEQLQEARQHFSARARLRDSRPARVGAVARQLVLGRYSRHAGGWRAALLDTAVPRSGARS